MKCPACQKDFDIEAAGFCPYCGTPMQSPRAQKACEIVETHFRGQGFDCSHDASEPNPNFSICFSLENEDVTAKFAFTDDSYVICTIDAGVDVPDDENSRIRAIAVCEALNNSIKYGNYSLSDSGRILLAHQAPIVEEYECATCETYASSMGRGLLANRTQILNAIDNSVEAVFESENYLLQSALNTSYAGHIDYKVEDVEGSTHYEITTSFVDRRSATVHTFTWRDEPLAFVTSTTLDVQIPNDKIIEVIDFCEECNNHQSEFRTQLTNGNDGPRVMLESYLPYSPGISYELLIYNVTVIGGSSVELTDRLTEIVSD